MELRHLRYLERVVAAGGFRRAARELGVAQPTLTTQIKQLERDLGVQLLDRSQRPIRMTPAGKVVIERVRELLAMFERLDDDIAEVAAQQQERLRLGANKWAAPIVPSLMAGFTAANPNVEVVLRETPSRDAPRLILSGDLDVCLLALRMGVETLPKQLQATRLFSFEHVFALPPGHRLERRRLIALHDLAHERLVITSGISGSILKKAFVRAGLAPHVAVETNDAEMLPSLVAQGMGIGYTPDFVVKRSHPELKTCRSHQLSIVSDALLTWTGKLGQHSALRAFVRFVVAQHWGREDLLAVN